MRTWTLEEAKRRLDELVRAARERGPQRVSLSAGDAVVVLSSEEYDRMEIAGPVVESPVRASAAGTKAAGWPTRGRTVLREEVAAIQAFVATLPDRDGRTADDTLGYDERGLP